MSSRLPEFVDPWRLADRENRFTGRIQLSKLLRLRSALLEDDGIADFELVFTRDEKRRVRITGEVKTTLVIECQRCLEAMELTIDAAVDLVVIEVADEADRILEQLAPIMAEDGQLRLLDAVEDELILAIPQVPRHPRGMCRVDLGEYADTDQAELVQNSEATEDNPFSVLAQLKSKLDS